MFKPSKYQERFFDELVNTDNNIVIQAVAGSGKTTTIVHSLELIPENKKIIFLAFNKSIVEELKERVPKNVAVNTLHSFGFKMMMVHNGRLKMDENKVYSLGIKMYETFGVQENKYTYAYRLSRLVDVYRMTLADLDDKDKLLELAFRFDIDIFGDEIEHAKILLDVSNKNSFERIDFCDMIYQPVLRNLKLRKYDYVFIDEVQDLNKCQQAMIKKMLVEKTGRLIAVGDSKQSIYGFAGADLESFNNMLTMLPNTVEIPLSVCYRCGKNIVEYAKSIVPYIEAFDGQKDGVVRDGSFKEIQNGDMVLCRNTRPLVELFTSLVADNKKAYIKGREIGKNLVNFINRRKKCLTINTMLEALKEDRHNLKIKLIKKRVFKPEEHSKMAEFDDKIRVIKILQKTNNLTTIKELTQLVEKIFLDDGDGICLSTIHKAKGREADRVFVLFKELLPSKYAKQEEDFIQEQNLDYVLRTRAKKELIYINDFIPQNQN